MTEIFNLRFGRTKENVPKVAKDPQPLKLPPIVLTRHFPPAKLYREYLREWMAKIPRRNDTAIRQRLAEEKADKTKTVL